MKHTCIRYVARMGNSYPIFKSSLLGLEPYPEQEDEVKILCTCYSMLSSIPKEALGRRTTMFATCTHIPQMQQTSFRGIGGKIRPCILDLEDTMNVWLANPRQYAWYRYFLSDENILTYC